MSLQTLTLNLSLNVHIGTDGTATVSLNTDNNRPIMPAQSIVEAPKQQRSSAPVTEHKPELKPATIVTQEQEQSVQETVARAFGEATAPAVTPPPPPPPVQHAPVTQAQPAVTPPPPPPPVRTPTPEELQQAYEAQKSWTPRPPEPEPTLAEVNGYMPQPMATQPPPSPAADEAAITRDSNIRATAAALFGGHH